MEVIISISLFLCFLFCARVEYADMYCEGDFRCENNKSNHSASYFRGLPSDTDTLKETLGKVNLVASHSESVVTWRRSLLTAIASGVVILFLLDGSVNIWKLLVITLVLQLILQCSFNFYKAKLDSRASKVAFTLARKICAHTNSSL